MKNQTDVKCAVLVTKAVGPLTMVVLCFWLAGCDEETAPPGPDADSWAMALDSSTPPDMTPPDQPLPTCTDKSKNGAETDVDCGGGTCPVCANGKGCAKAGDCSSGVYKGGICAAASCTDAVPNGDETDVDCGGGTCPRCANNKSAPRPPPARARCATTARARPPRAPTA